MELTVDLAGAGALVVAVITVLASLALVLERASGIMGVLALVGAGILLRYVPRYTPRCRPRWLMWGHLYQLRSISAAASPM